MKKLVMECVGTFFFILTIAMTGNPFAIASMLMAWVYIGGLVSGGHYNPMVSLAMAVHRKLSWDHWWKYSLAQVVGGTLAYAATYFFHHKIVIPTPGVGVSFAQAFTMEILLAFVLALVILVVATVQQYNHIYALAIGFTIPALAYVGGPISGGLFNPAIALGASLFGALKGMPIMWHHLAMYVVGALLGGYLAAKAFEYFYNAAHVVNNKIRA